MAASTRKARKRFKRVTSIVELSKPRTARRAGWGLGPAPLCRRGRAQGTAAHKESVRASHCFVSVTPLAGNCTAQLLEIRAIDPDICVVVTFIVPPNCPLHVGCDGTPSVPTRIVYAIDVPVSVPLKEPFRSTMPFVRLT